MGMVALRFHTLHSMCSPGQEFTIEFDSDHVHLVARASAKTNSDASDDELGFALVEDNGYCLADELYLLGADLDRTNRREAEELRAAAMRGAAQDAASAAS